MIHRDNKFNIIELEIEGRERAQSVKIIYIKSSSIKILCVLCVSVAKMEV